MLRAIPGNSVTGGGGEGGIPWCQDSMFFFLPLEVSFQLIYISMWYPLKSCIPPPHSAVTCFPGIALTHFRTMGFSIKVYTIKTGWSIVYTEGSQVNYHVIFL